MVVVVLIDCLTGVLIDCVRALVCVCVRVRVVVGWLAVWCADWLCGCVLLA